MGVATQGRGLPAWAAAAGAWRERGRVCVCVYVCGVCVACACGVCVWACAVMACACGALVVRAAVWGRRVCLGQGGRTHGAGSEIAQALRQRILVLMRTLMEETTGTPSGAQRLGCA